MATTTGNLLSDQKGLNLKALQSLTGGNVDLASYLSQSNPFINRFTGLSDTYSDALNATNWLQQQLGKYQSQVPTAGAGPWGVPWTGGGQQGANAQAGSNPFSLVSVNKFPELDQILSSYTNALSGLTGKTTRTGNMVGGYGGTPRVTPQTATGAVAAPDYSAVRNLAAALQKAGNVSADMANLGASTARGGIQGLQGAYDQYMAQYGALLPQMNAANQLQIGALNKFYTGDVGNQLAAEQRAQQAAENVLTNRGIQQAVTSAALGNAMTGVRPALNQALANYSRQVSQDAAVRAAERQRANTQYVLNAQQALAGRPQQLLSNTLQVAQTPYQLAQNMYQNQMALAQAGAALPISDLSSRLGALGSIANLTQYTDPTSQATRQLQLAILGQQTDPLSQISRSMNAAQLLANLYGTTRFTGVQKQGEDYATGVLPYYPSRYTPNYGGVGDFAAPWIGADQYYGNPYAEAQGMTGNEPTAAGLTPYQKALAASYDYWSQYPLRNTDTLDYSGQWTGGMNPEQPFYKSW